MPVFGAAGRSGRGFPGTVPSAKTLLQLLIGMEELINGP